MLLLTLFVKKIFLITISNLIHAYFSWPRLLVHHNNFSNWGNVDVNFIYFDEKPQYKSHREYFVISK